MEFVPLISVIAFCSIFLIYLYSYKSLSRSLRLIITLFFLFSLLSFTFSIVSDYFTGEGISEAVFYHLRFGVKGAGFAEHIVLIIAGSLFLVGSFFFFSYLIFKRPQPSNTKTKKLQKQVIVSFILLMLISVATNPLITYSYSTIHHKTIPSVTRTQSTFYTYYQQPDITAGHNPKNLVFIYAEGLERTYFNETLFPGLMPELKKIETRAISFTNIDQLQNPGWTMSGIVSSQCGIPLVTYSHGNSMSGIDSFLPSATCLSDLLADEGYTTSFMGGANLSFAGKRQFLESHSFDHINGKATLSRYLEDPTYLNDWGLYDDALLQLGYDHFMKQSQRDDPFALFLLTLDTHPPEGHIPKACSNRTYGDGTNNMLNAVSCSDYLLGSFIRSIQNSPFADETTIVIVSDHLAQRNKAYHLLTQAAARRNLFLIIDSENTNHTTSDAFGTHIDIGPTILPFLNLNGSIGLGQNLLGPDYSEETAHYIQQTYYQWIEELMKFWNFPTINEFVAIIPDQNKVLIDEREFSIPILIQFNDTFDVILKFSFHNDQSVKTSLVGHVGEQDKKTRFILIDTCRNLDSFLDGNTTSLTHYCGLIGKGDQYTSFTIPHPLKIDSETLRAKTDQAPFKAQRVAHAGGEYKNQRYTNSLEALDTNYEKGFRYFEVDLHFTRDGHIVCMHDWETDFRKTFGKETQIPLTFSEFDSLIENHPDYTRCTLSSLREWLQLHPDVILITDFKKRNKDGLLLISRVMPELQHQIIPQIYDPLQFNKVKELGFDQLIWTLYRYRGTTTDILDEVESFDGVFAVTMPLERAKTDLPELLDQKGIPTYAHTVNIRAQAQDLIQKNKIAEVYTDNITPSVALRDIDD